MILTKQLKGVCLIASNNPARRTLQGVHFEKGIATATDGYMLLQAPYQQEPMKDELPEEYKHDDFTGILPAKELIQALSAIPTKQTEPYRYAWTSKGKGYKERIVSISVGNTTIKEVTPIDATFPTVSRVLETNGEPEARVRLNPKLLKKLIDAIVISDPDGHIDIEIYGDYKPVHLKGIVHTAGRTTNGIHAVIMPIRVNE